MYVSSLADLPNANVDFSTNEPDIQKSSSASLIRKTWACLLTFWDSPLPSTTSPARRHDQMWVLGTHRAQHSGERLSSCRRVNHTSRMMRRRTLALVHFILKPTSSAAHSSQWTGGSGAVWAWAWMMRIQSLLGLVGLTLIAGGQCVHTVLYLRRHASGNQNSESEA